MSNDRILIIGAGIGGLALALALQRRCVPVAVFERAPELGEVGAGVMLTPNSNLVLTHLGVFDDVTRTATRPGRTQVRHYQTGAEMSTTDLGDAFTARFGKPYYDVHRVDIHSALHRAVAANDPACIRTSHGLVDVAETANGVRTVFENGATAEGRALVGCDGVRSIVRAKAGATDNARYTGNLAWRGLVPVERLPDHQRGPEITIWTGPRHHVVEYTIRNGRVKNYVAIANADGWVEEGWSVRSPVSDALDEFAGWHADVRAIIAATPADACYKWGLFDRDPLDRWSTDRITLLGDAAHPMLPFMAQGAAMALEDAVVLARCLATWTDLPTAFARYEAARKERTAWCQLQSRAAGKMFQRVASRDELDGDRAERGRRLYVYDAVNVPI
ncbi:MAG: FAD-dependent monooxygenase [Rhodospirillaceae bacterium]|nr:FAD-dependent monooxygenase [Rhodospirillaceae bacterium]